MLIFPHLYLLNMVPDHKMQTQYRPERHKSPQQLSEERDQARQAREEFWKAAYMTRLRDGESNSYAVNSANKAVEHLKEFLLKESAAK